MKRKYIIILLWGLWLCSLIIVAVCVNKKINAESDRLRTDFRNKVETLFENQSEGVGFITNKDGFFYEVFSGEPVRRYKEVVIPQKRITETYENWQQSYGDLISLYELNWDGDGILFKRDEGWNIIRMYYHGADDDFIRSNIIFPYKVGLKTLGWKNNITVEEAVDEAFDFFTTDAKSRFYDGFQKGSYSKLWSKIYDCGNRYYDIAKNMDYKWWKDGTPICPIDGKDFYEVKRTSPYEEGWMHNEYYRVFIAATQETHYMIIEKEKVIRGDKRRLFSWWGLGLSLVFFALIVPLMIIERKSKRKKAETLYQRLCRLCNPKEFMQNYDKVKVDKANSIYQSLMNTNPEDKETLMEIQAIAVSELGITLIEAEEVEELKERVNPQRFLNPYNAEKVALANELYATLSKDGLTYNEFVEVEEKAKSL